MSDVFAFCPSPPAWLLDWPAVEAAFGWLRDLAGCPQDPIHHAEGDVLTHTRMVAEALTELPDWRALPDADRPVLFAAALLHDVAKPPCTRVEPDGRVTSPGHARRGSVLVRRLLWRAGVPFAAREQVAALVRHHMVPFRLFDRPDPRRLALQVSQTARCDHLAVLAEADARGRDCPDTARLLDNVALFAEFCREQGCLAGPYQFPTAHTRFLYFRSDGRDPSVPAHDDFRSDVVLLSGLPGAGKDHWLKDHLCGRPVVSLDGLRDELDVGPEGPQGAVVNAARDRARAFLRAGEPFAWNATNLSRVVRESCINLFAAYRARVRVVYLEVPESRLLRQNKQRTSPVPSAVIDRLLDRWQVPDLTEAHEVEHLILEAP